MKIMKQNHNWLMISTLPRKVFVILDHPPKLRKHGGKNEASLRL
jgi:hypothetical protein